MGLVMGVAFFLLGCFLIWVGSKLSGIGSWICGIPGWIFVGTSGLALWHGMRKARAFTFVGIYAVRINDGIRVFEIASKGKWRRVIPNEYELAAKELEKIGEVELAKIARKLRDDVAALYQKRHDTSG